jgi:hypothetical protein
MEPVDHVPGWSAHLLLAGAGTGSAREEKERTIE